MKTFTLELVRTPKQRNFEVITVGGAKDPFSYIPDESILQSIEDVREFIRVYGVDELVSSFMNDENHYELNGQPADVTEVKQEGKKVFVTVEAPYVTVVVELRGRLILGAITD